MTLPMWLAWLLRSDVRGTSELNDQTAQKSFVCWWILFAGSEYAANSGYSLRQTEIAMEAEQWSGEIMLPRLLLYIWNSRSDLQKIFPPTDEETAADLLCWFRAAVPREYSASISLSARWLKLTEQASRRYPWCEGTVVPRMAVMLWAIMPDARNLFEPSNPAARRGLAKWYQEEGHKSLYSEKPGDRRLVRPRSVVRKQNTSSLGVNLVGFANAEFGIGEDVRMASRALESSGVPHVIINARTPEGVRGADHTRDEKIAEGLKYPITIFCMSAFDTAQIFLERGNDLFKADYNIGYWPWELPFFPKPWRPVTELVAEIWAGSRFQQSAYQATTRLPVSLMPLSVQPIEKKTRRTRKRAFTYIYPFDPRSFLMRKNPMAAIRAFRRAFPRSDDSVSLILRANGNPGAVEGWQCVLRAASGDRRIHILSGTLDRGKALSRLASCDCLISPHRSEGFGRNIAEALVLGVPVIGTAFSGPEDYLEKDERLRSRQKSVRPRDYPFGAGQNWAEPSIAELVRLMRVRRAVPPTRFASSRRAQRFLSRYSPEAAGERYRLRLIQILEALSAAKVSQQPSGKREKKRYRQV